jgi:hypothetical protein
MFFHFLLFITTFSLTSASLCVEHDWSRPPSAMLPLMRPALELGGDECHEIEFDINTRERTTSQLLVPINVVDLNDTTLMSLHMDVSIDGPVAILFPLADGLIIHENVYEFGGGSDHTIKIPLSQLPSPLTSVVVIAGRGGNGEVEGFLTLTVLGPLRLVELETVSQLLSEYCPRHVATESCDDLPDIVGCDKDGHVVSLVMTGATCGHHDNNEHRQVPHVLIAQLTRLRTLTLSGLGLGGSLDIDMLPVSLEELDLHDNDLHSVLVKSCPRELAWLALTDNKIEQGFEVLFKECVMLRFVYMNNNRHHKKWSMPESFPHSRLVRFDGRGCGLSGMLPPLPPTLGIIDIRDNDITEVSPDGSVPRIILMGHNKLTELPRTWFLATVEQLDLSHNDIDDVITHDDFHILLIDMEKSRIDMSANVALTTNDTTPSTALHNDLLTSDAHWRLPIDVTDTDVQVTDQYRDYWWQPFVRISLRSTFMPTPVPTFQPTLQTTSPKWSSDDAEGEEQLSMSPVIITGIVLILVMVIFLLAVCFFRKYPQYCDWCDNRSQREKRFMGRERVDVDDNLVGSVNI